MQAVPLLPLAIELAPPAEWTPTPQQKATFEWYFTQANTEGGNMLSGKDTVFFLRKSELPVDQLKQV